MFGSGVMHGLYSQFMMQAYIANSGKKIGLLRGASTGFATFSYTMHHLLWQKNAYLTTIHQDKICSLPVVGVGVGSNSCVRACVVDIEDKVFWKIIYVLLCAVYPAIIFLLYCDSNTPTMENIYTLAQFTMDAIEKSTDDLNDPLLFTGIVPSDGLTDW